MHLASYFCNCEAKSIPRIMKDNSTKTAQLVASAYEEYFDKVYRYIYFKINNREEAEDLAQDVFVRLMNYNQIICTDTIKFFIFTIARNLLKIGRASCRERGEDRLVNTVVSVSYIDK